MTAVTIPAMAAYTDPLLHIYRSLLSPLPRRVSAVLRTTVTGTLLVLRHERGFLPGANPPRSYKQGVLLQRRPYVRLAARCERLQAHGRPLSGRARPLLPIVGGTMAGTLCYWHDANEGRGGGGRRRGSAGNDDDDGRAAARFARRQVSDAGGGILTTLDTTTGTINPASDLLVAPLGGAYHWHSSWCRWRRRRGSCLPRSGTALTRLGAGAVRVYATVTMGTATASGVMSQRLERRAGDAATRLGRSTTRTTRRAEQRDG